MNWLVIILALLLALGGGYSAYLGMDIALLGRGWEQLLAAAVLASGAVVTFALAGVMFKLDGLRKAFSPVLGEATRHDSAPPMLDEPGLAQMARQPKAISKTVLATAGLATAGVAAAGAAAIASATPDGGGDAGEGDASAGLEHLHLPTDALPQVFELPLPEPPVMPAAAIATMDTMEVKANELTASLEDEIASLVRVEAPLGQKATDHNILDGDWLEQALASDETQTAPPADIAGVVDAAAAITPAEVIDSESDLLEDEVAREMSFARRAPQSESTTAPETASQPDVSSPVVGRYEASGVVYVMYADGSIDADDGASLQRFSSMTLLKAHLTPAL